MNEDALQLHQSMSRKLTINDIQEIVNRYPRSIRAIAHFGQHFVGFPVHHAIYTDQSIDVIRYLCDICPESFEIQNIDSHINTLLQLATYLDRSVELVSYLATRCPESLLTGLSSNGNLPIHLASRANRLNLDVIRYLAHTSPESLRVHGEYGYLPIHYICWNRMKWTVIPDIVELFPESLLIGTFDNSLPIHFSCSCDNPSVEAVKYLANACPASLKAKDIRGFLPIHKASANNVAIQIISILIAHYSEGLFVESNDKSLPIHLACHHLSTGEIPIIEAIQCPESLLCARQNGDLPLHCALTINSYVARIAVIRIFARLCPSSIHIPNVSMLTPLDIAGEHDFKYASSQSLQVFELDSTGTYYQNDFKIVYIISISNSSLKRYHTRYYHCQSGCLMIAKTFYLRLLNHWWYTILTARRK